MQYGTYIAPLNISTQRHSKICSAAVLLIFIDLNFFSFMSCLNYLATSSFDDYELSPDDREEVRLMFRFENIQDSSSDHRSEAANESGETKSESHDCQESKETASLNEDDIGGAKLPQSATTGVPAVGGDDHRTAKSDTVSPKIRMTDEMRDCRFERIVRENLERYPLDYDRDHQQKPTEATETRMQSCRRKCKTETTQKQRKTPPPIPSCGEFPNNEISGGEPDEFWKTLDEDDWNGTEAGSAGTPPLVQGNSLPRDSWIGPPPSTHDGPTCGFAAEANDRIRDELEGILNRFLDILLNNFLITNGEKLLSLLTRVVFCPLLHREWISGGGGKSIGSDPNFPLLLHIPHWF